MITLGSKLALFLAFGLITQGTRGQYHDQLFVGLRRTQWAGAGLATGAISLISIGQLLAALSSNSCDVQPCSAYSAESIVFTCATAFFAYGWVTYREVAWRHPILDLIRRNNQIEAIGNNRLETALKKSSAAQVQLKLLRQN